jgi:hypothetical protein
LYVEFQRSGDCGPTHRENSLTRAPRHPYLVADVVAPVRKTLNKANGT